MTKEIPEIYKRWIEALRSGKYSQGTGCLKNSKGEYCCLGVLCDIEGVEFYEDADGALPIEFADILGWKDSDGKIFHPDSKRKMYFSDLNDSMDLSFDQIADLIEKYWDTIE